MKNTHTWIRLYGDWYRVYNGWGISYCYSHKVPTLKMVARIVRTTRKYTPQAGDTMRYW